MNPSQGDMAFFLDGGYCGHLNLTLLKFASRMTNPSCSAGFSDCAANLIFSIAVKGYTY